MKQAAKASPEGSSLVTKICYAAGDVGCNFAWTFVSGFLLLYYTDSVGVSAAFAGTMMFVARVLDGASDIGMGVIIEKTHSRFGKARPWVLWGCVPLALSLALLFNVPETFGAGAKQVYMYATYIFMAVICYTAVNLSYNALLPRFSLTPNDRNIVSAVKGLAVIIAALSISILTPPLLDALGGQQSQRAWSIISVVYSVVALIMLLITFFGVKEKIPPNVAADGTPIKVPIKKALSLLLKNKYFYIATGLFVIYYAITGMGGVGVYYARDVMGDVNLLGLLSGFNILPMLLGLPITPILYKKFGKRKTMMIGALVSAVGCGLQLIAPANLVLFLSFAFIRGFGSIMFSLAIFTLASDIVELDERRNGIRTEGLVTSVNSFGMKVGTGVGSALVGWLLAFGGYSADMAVQSQSSINAMIMLNIGIPLVLSVLLAVLLIFWDMEKLMDK